MARAAAGRRGDGRRRGAACPQRVRGRGVAARRGRVGPRHRGSRAPARGGRAQARSAMSDPALGLTMLGLIVLAIMMGFPTAFTLMGLGMGFGYLAFWAPGQHWYDNQIFDLMVQRTYGIMTNDVLLSVPLFVFMGYIMERAALVDRMFFAVQLAFRPMLKAGYDVRLASGAITAGGTLGILIPPSVMLIVYAAVAGQSIVKL